MPANAPSLCEATAQKVEAATAAKIILYHRLFYQYKIGKI
jgi:hypothetical protein